MSRSLFKPRQNAVLVGLTETDGAWGCKDPDLRVAPIRLETPFVPSSPATDRIDTCRRHVRDVAGTSRLHWVIDSFSLNTWLQDVPAGLSSLQELERVVKARATQLFGPAPGDKEWAICADWKSHGSFLCQAIPSSLLQAFGSDSVYTPLTLALQAIRCAKPASDANGSHRWYAFTSPGEAHVMAWHSGEPCSLLSSRTPVEPKTHLPLILSLWRREQARTGWRSPHLSWLDWGAPDSVAPSSDVPCEVERMALPGVPKTSTLSEQWVALGLQLAKAYA